MGDTSIFDVSKYILEQMGEITTMKLQKLTFYVKAWGLVWDEEEIFPQDFQAWANGAVCYELYHHHRGLFKVNEGHFNFADSKNISAQHRETVDAVLGFYGKYTAQQLSDINHQETPWKNARVGCGPGDRCNVVITHADISEYYSGLMNASEEESQ